MPARQADEARHVLGLGRGESLALICAFVTIVIVGWSRFYDPFSGDQALFLIGAEKLQAGGVMYRDFWDIKQPGVFTFFLLGGRAFGFHQIGEHVADLVWQVAFAGALVLGLRDCFPKYRFVVAFAPLAVTCSYYAGSSSWHLLQVEELAGLPLFSCTWLLILSLERSSKRLALASGLIAGVVLLFKLIFLPIVVALALTVLWSLRAQVGTDALRSTVVRWFAGILIPVAFVAIYVAVHSTETTTLWTTFVVPIEVLYTADMHAPLARLADSATRFLLYYRGLILLALIGLVSVDRANSRAMMWR